jgi:hypothetical protein
MVDGFQKLQGGTPVKAVPWRAAPAGASGGSAAAASPAAPGK